MVENLMKLEVTTPERIFYDDDVKMVELTTTEGEIGILPQHIPTTMIVAPGILTITEKDGEKKEAGLMSGFIEITKTKVSILAEVAEWPGDIDPQRAAKAKERAERRLQSHEAGVDMQRAELALRRSLVRRKLKK
ncbi:MAG: ATP synthase F1 subunit epsilon [Anaerostipes sp.]|nr:ATP synthase F1 subunit epsilon [Anaerostipes sp.]